ncbi:calcium-binding protein, partial [Motiliproteus sp. SC1-56]|uniref:calcium-binding protein n=1 Tax=Motiliproteus sp. SC1-56 TaxID=2799565 RepID=UPI001A8ECDC2
GYTVAATGNELDNSITSTYNYYRANDILDGGLGADTMTGGNGDDTYYVDNAGDQVVENANQGTDTVIASVNHTLADYVENLTLSGSADLNATGNALNNVLTGNAGSNVLTGGAGNDTFRFDQALDAATNLDMLTDFTVGSDKIQLENSIFTALTSTGGLAADLFVSGAGVTEAADANDYLIYDSTSGALYYDPDGSGAEGAVQFASLSAGLALSAGDFTVS